MDNTTSYELSDHLGNVRAVISQEKKNGLADVLTYTDYYPFGSVLRSGGVGYRYGYQGEFSEKDEDTGWNSFDLRDYDSKIGRWMAPDKLNQFPSPYLANSNNPISYGDPDGRWAILLNGTLSGMLGILKGEYTASLVIAFDNKTGAVSFGTLRTVAPGVGIGLGGGIGPGVGFHAGANSVHDLTGWGTNIGLFGGILGIASLEYNQASDGNSYKPLNIKSHGGTVGVSVGGGLGGYLDVSFSWLTGELTEKEIKNFVNENLDQIRSQLNNSQLNTLLNFINSGNKNDSFDPSEYGKVLDEVVIRSNRED